MVLRPKWKCHNNVSEPLWLRPVTRQPSRLSHIGRQRRQRPRPLLLCLPAEVERERTFRAGSRQAL